MYNNHVALRRDESLAETSPKGWEVIKIAIKLPSAFGQGDGKPAAAQPPPHDFVWALGVFGGGGTVGTLCYFV